MLRLYTYWRSSAAYRVRIALNLKGLSYESVPVHLLRDGGEHKRPDYLGLHPQGLVPTLAADGLVVPQSLAICEYLEEIHPEPRLLPGAARDRATVRGMALAVACDVHPLNNLSILQYLRAELGADDAAVGRWVTHWIVRGFTALERWVEACAGSTPAQAQRACYGAAPTLADICLVPQMYNARRFGVDVAPFPRLQAICRHLEALPAFEAARPEAQPDSEQALASG
ncbi:MAG TPA: maleylacetoacetate isomerase [Steroidobacteraceae bacterium]|nr:maleylacetoacetate isomerase [Steroidobacteraceae bacterium]